MNEPIPRTPFSTPLSGSARETELRIRSIMSGPKRRPPVLFLALMFSLCLFCGNLVSCHVVEPEESTPVQLENFLQGDISLEESKPCSVTYQPGEQPLSEAEQTLLEALFRSAERENGYQFQIPTASLLASMEKDGWLLGAVFVEDHLENTLILGTMNRETGEVPDSVFQRSYHTGAADIVTFEREGADCLLYTFNGQENGQYTGEAGLIRFDGGLMSWAWPVEGDVRYSKEPPGAAPAAFAEYQTYWSNHLALPAPGGVDLYAVNPDFAWGQEEPWSMWQPESGETFYYDPGSAAELPMPIYFQALNWLIGYTADPGGWRITSLVLQEERSDPEAQTDCFTLRASSWDSAEALTADLFFNYTPEPARPRIYHDLVHAEVRN